MAYMNQEKKKKIVNSMKEVLKNEFPDFKVKATYSVRHHSSLVMTIRESNVDLLEPYRIKESGSVPAKDYGYATVNPYYPDRTFSGRNLEFFQRVVEVLDGSELPESERNFDKSDIMTDYFHVGWYVDIYIGDWDKPFKVVS